MGQLLHEFLSIFDGFCLLSFLSSTFLHLGKAHVQSGKCLTHAIVQFARNAPPFFVLGLQQLYGKVAHLIRSARDLFVPPLEFASPNLHLRVESIGESAVSFFAFLQSLFGAPALRDITRDLRSTDNLAARVSDGRNTE